MEKNKMLIPLFVFLFTIPFVSSHQVIVQMWSDKEMTEPYYNQFMWVYLKNRTFEAGDISYNATCYRAKYNNGVANITAPTNYYDLLVVDGAITWNNETNCPEKVENYDIWATAQSNMYIDEDKDLDYFVNTTILSPPRQYFWNLYSFRTILSIVAWVVIGGLLFVMAYFTKSGLAVILTFIVLLAIKLLIGI